MSKNLDQLINGFNITNIKPGLGRISELMSYYSNPHKEYPCILVGGTNGKGSITNLLSSIMNNHNLTTGLYTSPHLIRVNERIRVSEIMISDDEIYDILTAIEYTNHKKKIGISFFEALTASAFIYFEKNKVDIAIIEVGMGGIWDATNIVDPLVSVISNVSIDHTNYLGFSIDSISREKAGIIKDNVPAVTGCEGQSLDIIKEYCKQMSSDLYINNIDFYIDKNTNTYNGILWDIKNLGLKDQVLFQLNNISVSLAVSEILSIKKFIDFDLKKILEITNNFSLEGRMETIKNNPPLILDGAHNQDSANKLVKSIINKYKDLKFTFLVSIQSSKDYKSFINELSIIAECFIFTSLPNNLMADPVDLRTYAESNLGIKSKVIQNSELAYKHIINGKSPSCITGSLYLVGSIKELL